MAGKKSDLGPTGVNLTHAVRRFRGDLSYAELSRRLGELGRDIPPLGLRRIESGERRVDADDLMALAVALGVSPISLLMPATENGNDMVTATGVRGEIEARRLWRWLQAEMQLLEGKADAFFAFMARAIPSWRLSELELVESGIEPHVTRFLRENVKRSSGHGDDK